MDGYGIAVHNERRGSSQRYRQNGADTWDLAEAEALAYPLLSSMRATYVEIGNGEHELRLWADDVSSYGNFQHEDVRWARWYVDVQINGHRWRYRPVADLDDYPAADELAEIAATLHPDVTRIWVGTSDGAEELESEVRADAPL